jgi:hypothetical protein
LALDRQNRIAFLVEHAKNPRQMGFASKVALDQQFAIGRAFGASGTPFAAVLVDANKSNVASEVAVRAPGVLVLAGTHRTEA